MGYITEILNTTIDMHSHLHGRATEPVRAWVKRPATNSCVPSKLPASALWGSTDLTARTGDTMARATPVDAGAAARTVLAGSAAGNACESTVGLFRTEILNTGTTTCARCRDVEGQVARWVRWWHQTRPHSSIGKPPPVEFEPHHRARFTSAYEAIIHEVAAIHALRERITYSRMATIQLITDSHGYRGKVTTTPEMPTVFATADKSSVEGQRRTIRGTQLRLTLTVVAALCLAFAPIWGQVKNEDTGHHEIEFGAIVAAALFLLAFLIEMWLLWRRPQRHWYEGRAIAESVKTLTWRYAVGGHPYPRIRRDSTQAFSRDVQGLGTDIESLRDTLIAAAPTAWMEETRSRPLGDRVQVYLEHRVGDQARWYARKATHNRRRAGAWTTALLLAEALGVVLALLKGLGVLTIDLASVAAAIIASGAAWLAVKQHESIATAYELASNELRSVASGLAGINDEAAWAEGVADAEEAISREHTMWRASRSMPRGTSHVSP